MNPRTSTVDRILTTLLAVVLLLGGAWLAAWSLDRLPTRWWSPARFTVGLTGAVTGAGWWPWALMLGGVLVALIGLLWLMSHVKVDRVRALALAGGDGTGRLTMEASALASGAADALARQPGVSSASGRLVSEKNRVVLAITATVSPQADLRDVIGACDDIAEHALRSTARQDLACRIRVKVAARARSTPRVQ